MEGTTLKEEKEISLIYTIDHNTQLEFIRKTIVVIDKDRFLVCKQLMLDNAPDEDFAAFLNIPFDKVRYFKHKMQIFEDSIRARKRAARLNVQRKRKNAKPAKRKREISAEDRFKRARELIGKNYSTNQISKILNISERSVTRFKKRIRDEKRRLKAEGKIQANPNDPDDDMSFKFLSLNEKIKRAKELFQKQLKFQQISEILHISERSVRRWKDRITKMEIDGDLFDNDVNNKKKCEELKIMSDEENNIEIVKQKRKRLPYIDKVKVQYAKELLENGISNKEMSILLEMSIACVRKLKMKILNGTADELIDDSEEHYKRANRNQEKKEDGNDPLKVMPEILMPTLSPKLSCERKAKVPLSERDMYIVCLLRENQIRTMDIAKLMGISERSVSRLLSKAKNIEEIIYEHDIVEEVSKILSSKNDLLNGVIDDEPTNVVCEESKENLGLSLLAMNVKIEDIAKMLDVPKKTVYKWKTKVNIGVKEESVEYYYDGKIEPKEEYIIEYLE